MGQLNVDPETVQILQAAIANVLSALGVFVTYKIGMKQAKENGTSPPVLDAKQIDVGEKALAVVEPAMQQYATPDERLAYTGFQQNPSMFRPALEQALIALASRTPEFADELRRIGPSLTIQSGGIHSTVTVSGGTVNGPISGINSGSITYNANPDHRDR